MISIIIYMGTNGLFIQVILFVFYNLVFKYFAVDKVKAVCLFSSNFGHAMQTFKKFNNP